MAKRSAGVSAAVSRPSTTMRAGLRLHEVQDLHDRGGLAAARLADQPQRFALADVEADAVHGVHRADPPAQQPRPSVSG